MTKTTLTYYTRSYADRDIRCIYICQINDTIESLYKSFCDNLSGNIKVAIVKNKIIISDKYNEKIATVTFKK